jgi:hypothetical protein
MIWETPKGFLQCPNKIDGQRAVDFVLTKRWAEYN